METSAEDIQQMTEEACIDSAARPFYLIFHRLSTIKGRGQDRGLVLWWTRGIKGKRETIFPSFTSTLYIISLPTVPSILYVRPQYPGHLMLGHQPEAMQSLSVESLPLSVRYTSTKKIVSHLLPSQNPLSTQPCTTPTLVRPGSS